MEFFYKREDKTTNYRWFKNSYLIDYVKNSTLTKKQKEDLKKYVNLFDRKRVYSVLYM